MATRVCGYLDCGRPHQARGLCTGHYWQWRQGISLRPLRDVSIAPTERFWEKVNKQGPVNPITGTRCWLWTDSPNASGHGQFRVGKMKIYAHRFAWLDCGYEVPDQGWFDPFRNPTGWVLDHDGERGCGNPICVNPDHLELVPNPINSSRKRGARKGILSGVRGVARSPYGWRARATTGGVEYFAGTFSTIEEAGKAAADLRKSLRIV